MKKIKLIVIFIFVLVLETIFCFTTINGIGNIILKILFSGIIALGIDLITNLFQERNNKIIYSILITIISIVFIIYYLYYKLLGNILSLNSLWNGITQARSFASIIPNMIINNWYIIILFIALPIFLMLINKYISFERKNKKHNIIELIITIIMYSIVILTIHITSEPENIYSSKNLYYRINNSNENLKQFGLLTTVRLDIQRTITNFKEGRLEFVNNKENKGFSSETHNVLDIDFDSIAKSTNNEEIIEICAYLKNQEPTNKNEYTGRYKGKNLIVFMAESFSNMAIREDITPTLYKLKNEGIQFNNFYTPLFPVSTADGQYISDTSLIPAEGIWSIENVKGKIFPYSYANALKKEGYKTFAYHNYEYTYYKRDEYFETMGYDTYLGKGNGLENRMDFTQTPSSDYEMVKVTMDDYIHEERFVAYYMTMSGHMEYDKSNAMAAKNWDKVKDLPYSDKAKAYLATQIELDRALEEVIRRLEEAGQLENTVIVISGDHYPYGLSFEEMQEISSKKIDQEFEKFNMPFIIYNSGEKEQIISDKYSSSLDILPTILNLFGLEYDSRLLMGKDIFSDSEPLVIFSNRSFITNEGRYNSTTENYKGQKISDNYIANKKKEIYYKYRYSRLILENNFYELLF